MFDILYIGCSPLRYDFFFVDILCTNFVETCYLCKSVEMIVRSNMVVIFFFFLSIEPYTR